MSNQPTSQASRQAMIGGPREPAAHGSTRIEKAHNPRGALVRLAAYLRPYKLSLDELLAQGGFYHHLYWSQFKGNAAGD